MLPPSGRAGRLRGAAAVVALLGLLLAGCSGGPGGSGGSGSDSPGEAAPSGPATTGPDDPGTGSPTEPTEPTVPGAGVPTVPPPGPEPIACPAIRDGIDAFNDGDLQGTVEQFEDAVPLARQDARERPSRTTKLLVRATRYYARLPAEQYLKASTESPVFLKWKALTLGVCQYGGGTPATPRPSDDTLTA